MKMVDIIFMIAKQNFVIMYYLWYHLQNQIVMREYANKPENQSRTLDSNPKASRQAPIDVILQRYKERNIQQYVEDEELIQGKFSDTVQREEFDEDELLQGKFESDTQTEQQPVQREEKPNNTGLPDNLKSSIENLSGYSMDDVKVHYNSSKPAQLQALAYAQGTDIHVAPGQEKHLPHEAWHVIQQKQGRVQPTVQMQGISVNDDEELEKEAFIFSFKAQQLMNNTSEFAPINKLIKKQIPDDTNPIQLFGFVNLLSFLWKSGVSLLNMSGIFHTIISFSDDFFQVKSGYHTTPQKHIESIGKIGLEPEKGGSEDGASELLSNDDNRDHFKEQSKGHIFITDELSIAQRYKENYSLKGIESEIIEIKLPNDKFLTDFEVDPESPMSAYRSSIKLDIKYIIIPTNYSWLKKIKFYCQNFDFSIFKKLIDKKASPKEIQALISYFSILGDFLVWYYAGPFWALLSLGAGVFCGLKYKEKSIKAHLE